MIDQLPDPTPAATDHHRVARVLALMREMETLLDARTRALAPGLTTTAVGLTAVQTLTADLDRLLAVTPAEVAWLHGRLPRDPLPVEQAVADALRAAPLDERRRRAILEGLAERGGFAAVARAALGALIVNAPVMRQELAASLQALDRGQASPRAAVLDWRCAMLGSIAWAACLAGQDGPLARAAEAMEAGKCLC